MDSEPKKLSRPELALSVACVPILILYLILLAFLGLALSVLAAVPGVKKLFRFMLTENQQEGRKTDVCR